MIQKLRERLEADTGGVAIFALVILSLLYFFDEFDTAAFGVLAPDIEKAFHLSDQRYGALVILNVSVLLLLAIPVGYLADRVKRTRLVVLSGLIAGVFSFGTGIAGTIGILTLMRFGNGVGLLGNIPIHNSLLADYYPVENRAQVFGDHSNAVQLGAIAGPVFAGVLGSTFGWRAPFLILTIPILITTWYVRRLDEPARGATDDPERAVQVGDEDSIRFREGVRVLWSVRTLRRQFIGSLFFGAGTVPMAFLLPLYLERVYHIDPFGRGVIGAIHAGATFYGVRRSGSLTRGWFAKGMDEPLKRSAYCLMAVGVGIALVAAAPWFILAFLIGTANAFVIGMFTPPFTAVQALVSPARARTMSFSFGALFLVVGVVFLWLPFFSGISDKHGIRWGLGVLSPYWVIAGLILASAAKFVGDDAAAGLRSLAAAAAARGGISDAEGHTALLVARGVDVAYDQTQVLFGVDLDVYEGEIVALLGTNGAGKSTLLKAISGLNPAVNGAIFFDGKDIARLDTGVIAHLGIAQVPGGRGIFPSLTVEDNIRAAGWMYRGDRGYLEEATARVLEYFPILKERWETSAGSLSGGEQQMLSLAQAFIAKPRLLMIDELSLGLAPTIVDRLLEIVRAIHDNGTTVILVEQSVNVALRLAKRAVFMEKGEIRFSGPTSELLGRTDILRSVFLKGAASLGPSGNGNGNGTSNGKSNGKSAKTKDQIANALLDNPIVLETRGLTKRYGGVTAVNDVDLQLHQGQILGLIGPNGAGKTSIFDLISGFQTPDRGFVALEGHEVTQWPAWRRANAGLARGFQDARLWPSLTVREALAAAVGSSVTSPLPAFLGLPAAKDAEAALAARVEEVIELLGLTAFRDKFISELSTGSRRIVEIASLLPNAPKVIILDEPSSGIAQKETEALGPLLKEVQRYLNCSILLIEHDMPLISSLADHLVGLELGEVIAFGRPAEVLENPRVVESYLGNTSYTELSRN